MTEVRNCVGAEPVSPYGLLFSQVVWSYTATD